MSFPVTVWHMPRPVPINTPFSFKILTLPREKETNKNIEQVCIP